jgi:hypothetical protein
MIGQRPRARTIYLLLVLAALALPLEASGPIHVHHGDVPGLYNGECLLATLAAFHGVAPLPDDPGAVSVGLVVGPALSHAAVSIISPVAGHGNPRAPPLS